MWFKKKNKNQSEQQEPKKELGMYRLVYDKNSKDWVIYRDNSEHASRRCKTKKEAQAVLKQLCKNQEASSVVHKKDGKFQKKR